MGRLEPIFDIQGIAYALHTAEMAAVPSAQLKGALVADLSEFDHEIRAALDMISSGF
ncbi:CcdB family protein [Sulfitobacter dubius]|uniref:CcdB family protein n=1 Tax=Sulfitobacter dubius TaxID=218673 RepID=UPI0029430A84|nr:CcdB family protein [Sulfitobacter dubius]WOI31102.1 CcdB family protein [Sulfitobacter dubius]